MYGWFFRNMKPNVVMDRLFRNPECNLHQFWRPGGLYFRHCKNGGGLCREPGTLVTDDPDDTLLYPKNHPEHPKIQWEFKDFSVTTSKGKSGKGYVWYGVKKYVADRRSIVVPPLISTGRNVAVRKA